jgi:hypothetical protein
METVYDHNPTENEIADIRKNRIKLAGDSQNSHYVLISELYANRNDIAKARQFAKKISNERLRFDILYCLAESPKYHMS